MTTRGASEVTPWKAGVKRTTVSGCEIRYLRCGAGRPVVLLHPLRTQLDYFFPLLQELDQGFEVLALAKVLFTAMLWPVIGSLVARSGSKGVLRRVLQGGLHDPRKLPPELVDELHRSGSLPGHARAFRSLCLHWRSWIEARAAYAAIRTPVTMVYGEYDWSRREERAANERAIPDAPSLSLQGSGHFSCLEEPQRVARIILEGR